MLTWIILTPEVCGRNINGKVLGMMVMDRAAMRVMEFYIKLLGERDAKRLIMKSPYYLCGELYSIERRLKPMQSGQRDRVRARHRR